MTENMQKFLELVKQDEEMTARLAALREAEPGEAMEQVIGLAKEKGLVGMECYYSLYDGETTSLSLALAEAFQLKCSGGSDFHGDNKPDIQLGTGKGNLQIPYDLVTALKAAK